MGTVVNHVLSSLDEGSLIIINHTIKQSEYPKHTGLTKFVFSKLSEPGSGRKRNKGRRREIMTRKWTNYSSILTLLDL